MRAIEAAVSVPMVTMPAATRANRAQLGACVWIRNQPPTAISTSRAVPASSGPQTFPAPWLEK